MAGDGIKVVAGVATVAAGAVGGPAAGKAAGILGALAGYLGSHSAAARMEARISESMAEWLEERVADVERGLRNLEGKVDGLRPTDALPAIEAIARAARTTGDPNKRKLLEVAARRAFDPELYASGMTVVLLEKLERLSYGDVAFLRRARVPPQFGEAGLEFHHAKKLVAEDLAWMSQGQFWTAGQTQLGMMLLRLLTEDEEGQAASSP